MILYNRVDNSQGSNWQRHGSRNLVWLLAVLGKCGTTSMHYLVKENNSKHLFSAERFHNIMNKKVTDIRTSTAFAGEQRYVSNDMPPLSPFK